MTNAIEQSKREMYNRLANLKACVSPSHLSMGLFELDLETYLELLRQDHEALHETARKRFEDLQKSEKANFSLSEICDYQSGVIGKCAGQSLSQIRDLESRLAKMTEERDAIQLRLHAVDHAYNEQQSRAATLVSNSGENVDIAKLDGKTAAILGAVVDCQRIVTDWAMNGLKAKKAIRAISAVVNGSPRVLQAMLQFERPASPDAKYAAWMLNNLDHCQHSFFAIGDEQPKCIYCREVAA